MKKLLCFIILFFSLLHPSFSKEGNLLDSLFTVLKTQKEDIIKVNTLNAIAFEFRNNNPDTAIYFSNKALQLATKLKDKIGIADAHLQLGIALMNLGRYDESLKYCNKGLIAYQQLLSSENLVDRNKILKKKASAYNNIGIIYWYQGNYSEALKNHFNALEIRKEIKDKKGIAICYNNIGLAFSYLGNYPEALKSYFAALKTHEELGDKLSIAAAYINIGNIYRDLENYPAALKNFFAGLKIEEEIGDKRGIAASLNGIGSIYEDQNKFPDALIYFTASLKIREDLGDIHGISQSYNNIGLIYYNQKNYDEALLNLFKSLKIKKEIGDDGGIADAYNNIGNVYREQKNYIEANLYLNKSLLLSRKIGNMESIKYSYLSLATLDSAQGNYERSLRHYKKYLAYKDSIDNTANTNLISNLQIQYDTEKKEQQITLLTKQSQLQKTELQKHKTTRNVFIAASLLIALLAGITFSLYRVKQKANAAIKKAMNHLKTTQEQLIEREKLASLGKLTADVAKEIEVPLLQINKLVIANQLLIQNLSESAADAESLKNNLLEIYQYGKDADAVVKRVLIETRKVQV
jgi:tetratricopeptide (TPR) repeat protein